VPEGKRLPTFTRSLLPPPFFLSGGGGTAWTQRLKTGRVTDVYL